MLLYEQVRQNLDGTEELLTLEQCSKISMLTEPHAEDIYLLIIHYFCLQPSLQDSKQSGSQLNRDLLSEGCPYAGKLATKEGRGVLYRPSQLPEQLQKLIYRYLKCISN